MTELQAENAQRHEITIDSVTEQLTKAYEMAIARRQPSAAVGACMALARLHGLFTSRVEVQARNYVISTEPEGGIVSEAPPHPMTDEEWEAKYGRSDIILRLKSALYFERPMNFTQPRN